MRIFVKAKAGSKKNEIIPPDRRLWSEGGRAGEYYTVYVKDPPEAGKANIAIAKLLAEHFNVSHTQVFIVSGLSSKIKVFEIRD